MSLVKLSGIVLFMLTGTALTVNGYVESRSPRVYVPVVVQPPSQECDFSRDSHETCEALPCGECPCEASLSEVLHSA